MLFRRWKRIEYRGGVVTFRIPRDWVEKYEPEGGGTFYSTRPSCSSTLRLNVHTFRSSSQDHRRSVAEILRDSAVEHARDGIVHPMPSGDAYVKSIPQGEEDGNPLVFYCWEVGNVIPPSHFRLAVFALTTLAFEHEQALRDVKWLDREIRNCRFARELGVGGDWQPT